MDDLTFLLRLLLATLLGGLIGLERERSGKPAGLRTNILMCVGAALITDLSSYIAQAAGGPADHTRIAAGIVSGVGFIGAGTILQARGSVHGLTTAATLWVVAAIGMGVGSAAYTRAIGTTVIVMITLALLGRIEAKASAGMRVHTLRIELENDPTLLSELPSRVEKAGLPGGNLDITIGEDGVSATFRAEAAEHVWAAVTRSLLELRGVRRVALR